jgi:hypothetical protein
MNMSKSQAPRANAGSRANSKAQEHQIIASAVDWEADPATIWFARRFPMPTMLARVLAALASRGGLSMNGPIDFAEINRAALAAFPAVLACILPGGKRVGTEIVALNPRRADRRLGSFKVNRFNGRWCDFATGDKGGDVVSLVAYLEGVSQGEAARRLARMLGLEIGGRRHG